MSFEVFHIPVDHVSEPQLDVLLRSWVHGYEQKMIVTPNPEMLLLARKDERFSRVLQRAHLSLPDGVGVRYAVAALSPHRLMFRHTGVDTLYRLAQICEDAGKPLVLFGGRGEANRRAAQKLREQFKELQVVSINPGEVIQQGEDLLFDADILAELRRLKPAVLAVALGAGKQEHLIEQYMPLLPSVRVAIGVGGAVDMIGEQVLRAPRVLRRMGLEWLWRLLQEPRRLKRIMRATMIFPCVVAYDSLRQRKFVYACRRVLPEVARQFLGK